MVVDVTIRILNRTGSTLIAGFETAIPRLVAGLVFAIFAYLGIRLVLAVLRFVLTQIYTERQTLIIQLFVMLAGLVLWFGAILTFLKIVGLGDIAASLGTAVGFIALGISYALSDMIEDSVSGIYLLRDPDFELGDRVVTDDGTEGRVTTIEIRKSRFDLDNGDTVIVANRDVESGWTKRAQP